MTSSFRKMRLSVGVEFTDGTSNETKNKLMYEIEETLSLVINEGENKESGDGKAYNDVEYFATKLYSSHERLSLYIEFREGSNPGSPDDVYEDIDDVLDAIFYAGNYNGDGEFYDAAIGYRLTRRNVLPCK